MGTVVLMLCFSFGIGYSLLDRPCVVFPVSHVDPALDTKTTLEKPYQVMPDGLDQEFWDRCKYTPSSPLLHVRSVQEHQKLT